MADTSHQAALDTSGLYRQSPGRRTRSDRGRTAG